MTIIRDPSGPLDMHFRVMHSAYLAAQHVGHWTLLVWHKSAVRAVQPERAAEPLVGIPRLRFATP